MTERTTEDKLKRLAALREKDEARKVAKANAAELEELAALEELDTYETKNGPLPSDMEYLRVRDRLIILKPPAFQLYRRFIDKKDSGSEDAIALVRSCVVHPSREQFDAICEQYPVAPIACLERVAILAGISQEKLGK